MRRIVRTVGISGSVLLLPAVLLATPRRQAVGSGQKSAAQPVVVCADSVKDQAAAGCLQASSTPTAGMLFPPPHDGGRNNATTGLDAFVGGGRFNTAHDYAVVGGGRGNTASGYHSTVSGGYENYAPGYRSTIGGGSSNKAFGLHSTVGGGGGFFGYSGNVASGGYSTVSGGSGNIASGHGSTVAGGGQYLGGNEASGEFSAVGGGEANQALSFAATVPGGLSNVASGAYSFAAGRRAKADHAGAFVWGDSFDGDKTSSVADQFNVYASGGTRIFSNSTATTGVLLAPGASMWSMVSDRDAKESIEPVDGRAVLERVAELPISTWNYREQDGSVRHMGPMAQDFYAAFGLGLGDKTIDAIDPGGVALAALQGVTEELARLQEANERLSARLQALEGAAETDPRQTD